MAARKSAPDAGVKHAVLIATVGGSSLAFIDGSVVNIALPQLQANLGASAEAVQWVAGGYMLALSALVLAGGSAADRFGRRRMFMVGVAGFLAASLGCSLAPDAGWLIAARAAQGLAAALLTPASLALIDTAFERGERGRAFGLWAGAGALCAAAGPVLGGWLVEAFGWRSIFLINLPVGAVALIAARWVPESRDAGARSLDWLGTALIAGGLGALTWGLTAAGRKLDIMAIGAMAAGAALIVAFVVAEARERTPMMPLSLYRSRTFSGLNLLTLALYFALGLALFVLPFELIRARGFPPVKAGAALLPFALVMGLLSHPAGWLADKVGPRWPLTVGPMVVAAAFAWLGLAPTSASPWLSVVAPLAFAGLGMTLAVGPLTSQVIGAVEDDHAGVASGVNNAVARIAGLMAVAIVGLAAPLLIQNGADAGKAHGQFTLAMLVAAGCAAAAGLAGLFSFSRGGREGR